MKARHVLVTGRVQGVSFRAWMREQAEARSVSGWVRNLPNGSVEAVVSGTDEAVEALIDALHQGPSAAGVTEVCVSETEAIAETGFHITG